MVYVCMYVCTYECISVTNSSTDIARHRPSYWPLGNVFGKDPRGQNVFAHSFAQFTRVRPQTFIKKVVVGKYLMRGKLTFCEDPYLLSLKIYSTFSNHVILIYVYLICFLEKFRTGDSRKRI